jgi:hypothetical protein
MELTSTNYPAVFLHDKEQVKRFLNDELIIQEYFSFQRVDMGKAVIKNIFDGGNFYFKVGDTVIVSMSKELKKRIKRNRLEREKREIYKSLGLSRVKGNLGGIYYE